MKHKILFALINLMLPVYAMGQLITDDEAKGIASRILGKQVVKAELKKSAKILSSNGETMLKPSYSIFIGEDENGFVIVSTDRRAPQIIGYGVGKADANNLPPQLKAILEKQDSILQSAPNLTEHSSWRKPAPIRAGSEGGKLLKTANWGQDYPYNLMTPVIEGEHCPTGCVATAMAIVMQYHAWPEQGRKLLLESFLEVNRDERKEYDFSEIHFDWTALKSKTAIEDCTETEKEMIAQLMHYAGMSVDMWYYYDRAKDERVGSAPASNISSALKRNFSFSADITDVGRWNTTDEQFLEIIKNNIDLDMPLLLTGTTFGTGHEFVCDGYTPNGMLHINWGWDGLFNGYFNLDGSEDGSTGFATISSMVANIHPAKDEDYSDCFLHHNGFLQSDNNIEYCSLNTTNVEKNIPFDFTASGIIQPLLFRGKYGVALVDKEGNIKEILNSTNFPGFRTTSICNIANFPTYFHGCVVKDSDIADTDYISLATLEYGDTKWKILKDKPYANSRIAAKDNDSKISRINWHCDTENMSVYLADCRNSPFAYCSISELQERYGVFPRGARLCVNPMPLGVLNATVVNGGKPFCFSHEYASPVDFKLTLLEESYDIAFETFTPSEEQKRDITLEVAGTLPNKLAEPDHYKISNLTLHGEINSSDLEFINNHIYYLNHLDMQDCVYRDSDLPAYGLINLLELNDVVLPRGLKTIGAEALARSKLKFITISETVEQIADYAFNCSPYEWNWGTANHDAIAVFSKAKNPPVISATTFHNPKTTILYVVTGCKEAYSKAEGWKDFQEIIEDENPLMEEVIVLVNGIKYRLKGSSAEIAGSDPETCPETIEFESAIDFKGKIYPVITIAGEAFKRNTSLKNVIIPESVTEIKNHAFLFTQLNELTINARIEEMSGECFGSVRRLTLPPTLKRMRECGITGLEYISIPASLESISNYTLSSSRLTEINLDKDNTNFVLFEGALYTADMKTLTLYPSGRGDKIIRIPEGVEYIMARQFAGNKTAEQIQLPSTLKNIPEGTFGGNTNLEHIVVPDGVTQIHMQAIGMTDEKTKYLTIGQNVIDIDYLAIIGGNENNDYHFYLKNNALIALLPSMPSFAYKEMNIYTGHTTPNFSHHQNNENIHYYIPGECTNSYQDRGIEGLREMWQYFIHRDINAISISNVIEGLEIQSVHINGKKIEAIGSLFYYEPSDELDVVIIYRLHDRQDMITHYDAAFNAMIKSTDKVSDILMNDNSTIVVTAISGFQIYKGPRSEMPTLPHGVYILQQGGRTVKVCR